MQAQILAPAAVLVLWSLIMLTWLAITRLPAIAKAGGLSAAKPGGRGQDLEGVIDDRINWKSHNYTHLMEQPTIFYATVAILAIMGAGALDVLLAWAYVAIRIVHSLWQATVNRVPVRFTLFSLATASLLVLAVRAVMATLLHDPATVTG
ncbi:MAPEG family protein [Novosphingobium sp. Gsoil 351]|uniref:MAPEG family protein n=1 Tax=Novosphingobium sp. Gsoil 351 TaxID=2675225 RepID=UPI0012B4526F|nr:MAPEG family protein [Novosphingobium sp. Gsoil 351]QGN53771.1 MAPEG family protein [Novosphingobium sp. Gsoil 351]